jgi:hypothetical protein
MGTAVAVGVKVGVGEGVAVGVLVGRGVAVETAVYVAVAVTWLAGKPATGASTPVDLQPARRKKTAVTLKNSGIPHRLCMNGKLSRFARSRHKKPFPLIFAGWSLSR